MKLELEEGRVYGARYWVVHPVPEWDLAGDWGSIHKWDRMVEWAVKTFGPTPEDGVWVSGQRWYVNNARFYFRNEPDRDWFLLKWA